LNFGHTPLPSKWLVCPLIFFFFIWLHNYLVDGDSDDFSHFSVDDYIFSNISEAEAIALSG
jgi:hypothetical protein